jgi:Zn-dependent protease
MTQLVEGGRPIARFRLLGFPVHVDISFVIIIAVLGWYPGVTAKAFVVWLVMVPIAVLTHELGHAFVARSTGAEPSIALAGLGGLTTYVPPRPLSRARSFAISVAGPAVGLVIGGALIVYGRTAGVPDGLATTIVNTAIFTTLGWSLLNLLPVLPLDGGQALRELLPGAPATREARAAMVSVVVAAVGAVVAYRFGLVFGALMAAFFVFSNVMTVRAAREQRQLDVNARAVRMLWAGRVEDARALAGDPTDDRMHPLVRAAVRAASEDPAERAAGTGELQVALAGRDSGGAAALLLAVDRVHQDWAAARDLVAAANTVDPGAVLGVVTAAHQAGAQLASAQIGQAWLDRGSPGTPPAPQVPATIAYNTACGWAAVGDLDRGVAAFRAAADLGFADLTMVDSDEDLAPLRPLPGYDEARSTIRRRALAAAGETPGG